MGTAAAAVVAGTAVVRGICIAAAAAIAIAIAAAAAAAIELPTPVQAAAAAALGSAIGSARHARTTAPAAYGACTRAYCITFAAVAAVAAAVS